MEFFGIGAPELMVILVIAIVLFGPDKIPTMAAQVGKTIREFRRYTSELTKEFDAATGDLRSEFQNIAGDLRGELEATQADLRSQLDLTDVFKDTPKEVVSASVAASAETETQTLPVTSGETTAIAAESAQTITVTTPYADAIAAETAAADQPAALERTPMGAGIATKADPFADLATLVVTQPATEPVTVLESAPVASLEDEMASIGTSLSAETPVIEPNGKPRPVGGSVAGSKYTRRRSR